MILKALLLEVISKQKIIKGNETISACLPDAYAIDDMALPGTECLYILLREGSLINSRIKISMMFSIRKYITMFMINDW